MKSYTNEIRKGIAAALHKAFPDAEIYTEEIKQDLNPPCFYIQVLEPEHNQALGKVYNRKCPVCIQYFSPEQKYQADCSEKDEALYLVLEYITLLDESLPINGIDMHSKVEDGVLSFFVTYDYIVHKEEEIPLMGPLESYEMKEIKVK